MSEYIHFSGADDQDLDRHVSRWLRDRGWFKQLFLKLGEDAARFSELATPVDIAESFERILNESLA